MIKSISYVFFCFGLLFALSPSHALAAERLRIALTTSVENSGLLEHLRPKIYRDLGVLPHFIITGTGKALRLGVNKDIDALWVHDPLGEQAFMQAGHGINYAQVMYSYFVLVGPKDDPANVQGKTILEALQAIERAQANFVSRGDDSGTHRQELSLWQSLNPDHDILQKTPIDWYHEAGSSMGAALNIAVAKNAYVLTDEATWLKFANKGNLSLLLRDNQQLLNPYGLIVVDGTGRAAETDLANAFFDWVVSKTGQEAINSYRIDGVVPFVGAYHK